MTDRLLIDGLTGAPSALLVEDERITALGTDATAAGAGTPRLGAAGLRAVPGLIELQVNGSGDADVTSDPRSMWRLAEILVRHGVTAFLPTVVSGPPGTVEAALGALADGPTSTAPAAVPLGLHVEGPFLAPARRGAHDPRALRAPDHAELERWVPGGARLVTLAPELAGGVAAVERIAAGGGIAAIGHTEADADTVRAAIAAGARYATHLFNAMPPFHHRAPGPVGALLDDERVTIGLIADGVHVDRLALRLVARAAPGRVSLVSDAVGARLGGTAVRVEPDAARLAGGRLAGAVHLLDHGLRTYAAATGSTDAALEAVTSVPARLLGLEDGRGTLCVGGRADIVLLNEELQVAATIVGGRPAHRSDRVRWP